MWNAEAKRVKSFILLFKGSGCQENSSSRIDYDQAVDQKNRHQVSKYFFLLIYYNFVCVFFTK